MYKILNIIIITQLNYKTDLFQNYNVNLKNILENNLREYPNFIFTLILMSYSSFADIIKLDTSDKENDKFCKLWFVSHNSDLDMYNLLYIISAVTSYRNEGYSDYNKRHEYLYPVNENESENDSENDDYEYEEEDDEDDELSSVDRNIYQTNCKLIDVVLRDTKIINDSVKGVECEVRAIGYNLHLCFVFDPKRLFKDNKVAYWHDVDVNRKIAFLFTITYKTSLYIYNNAAELNRFNNLNVIGFQTNDSAKKVYYYYYYFRLLKIINVIIIIIMD